MYAFCVNPHSAKTFMLLVDILVSVIDLDWMFVDQAVDRWVVTSGQQQADELTESPTSYAIRVYPSIAARFREFIRTDNARPNCCCEPVTYRADACNNCEDLLHHQNQPRQYRRRARAD